MKNLNELTVDERVALAESNSTSTEVLEELAKDEEKWVRWGVARN